MHDPRVALDAEQFLDPPRAGDADPGDVVAGEIDQHHMLGRLLGVEPHLGLEPVVLVAGRARAAACRRSA